MIFSDMESAISDLLERTIAALPPHISVYLVGGAIRDLLLQRPIHDLDFVLSDNAIKHGRRIANQLGADFFPLDAARDNGRLIVEIPPNRKIRLDFARQRGPNIENDLQDRDFTINAIAVDIHNPGRLIDPCNGAQDLLAKEIRLCAPEALINDPVRIIRAVRLSFQLDFIIPPETAKAIRKSLPGLSRVTSERLRDELFRILDGSRSSGAIRLLDTIGALSYLLPELSNLKDFQQPEPHILDLWNHTLSALRKFDEVIQALDPIHKQERVANWALGLVSLRLGRYRKDLQTHFSNQLNPDRSLIALVRLAILYHDAGKPQAASQKEGGKVVFYGHDLIGEQIAKKRGAALRMSNLEIDRFGQIIRGHMRPFLLADEKAGPTQRAVYRFFRDLGAAGVDVCLISLSDMLATYGPALPQEIWTKQLDVVRTLFEAWWEHPAERISPPALLNGDDIIKAFDLKPGPLIGELLELIREAQAAGEINQTEEAFALARQRLGQG